MRFKAKKVYGQYQTITCPFCSRRATSKNEQGLDVCHLHTKQFLSEQKCFCGNWLDLRIGKFGPYFNCVKCGNINFKKIDLKTPQQKVRKSSEPHLKKEITITTNDVNYFD